VCGLLGYAAVGVQRAHKGRRDFCFAIIFKIKFGIVEDQSTQECSGAGRGRKNPAKQLRHLE